MTTDNNQFIEKARAQGVYELGEALGYLVRKQFGHALTSAEPDAWLKAGCAMAIDLEANYNEHTHYYAVDAATVDKLKGNGANEEQWTVMGVARAPLTEGATVRTNGLVGTAIEDIRSGSVVEIEFHTGRVRNANPKTVRELSAMP